MVAPSPLPLPPGYTLRRATLRDLRALYRLERLIFPRDAYPYFDLALLFLTPGVINLKIAAPDGSLGAALLVRAEARIGRPCIRLTVRESNQPAIRLYQRAGYAVIERKIGYNRDGEAGLVMEKRIGAK